MKKKAQIWTLDFIAGLLIFIVIIFIVIALLRNYVNNDDSYQNIVRESDHISSMLAGEGFPPDWNSTNVIIPGIADNNRINLTKLDLLNQLTYPRQKTLFQNTGEFVFYFYNGAIINESQCFHGYPLPGCTLAIPDSAKNVAKTERIVILNSSIVKLIVITWN